MLQKIPSFISHGGQTGRLALLLSTAVVLALALSLGQRASAQQPPRQDVSYTVQPGDTLFSIAQQFGTTVVEIQTANNISDPSRIVAGQQIIVPATGNPNNGNQALQPYTVQIGDTLFSIAQRFGTTVEEIQRANNIEDPSAINAGQVILIPAQTYTVQPGDTLFSIAQRFGTSVEAIAEANNIVDPAVIEAGQVLTIPPADPAPPGNDNQAVCLVGEGFGEDGNIGDFDRAAGDARQVLDFRLGVHEGCERVVIDLATEDGVAAQTIGPVEAEFLRDQGVVRLRLTQDIGVVGLTGTESEAVLGGELAHAAYFVRALEGGPYVDVHLVAAVQARVFVLDGPARLVVDLRPGGEALPGPAAVADNVVVLTPRGEQSETYPLQIRGYARTFEANVIALVRQGGVLEEETFTTAASWAETWGEFELTVEDGPAGQIELFVGERSAKDGTEQGVRIPLFME
jgi:LysM repeat protein